MITKSLLLLQRLSFSHRINRHVIALGLLLLSFQTIRSQFVTPTPPPSLDAVALELNQPVEREMSGKPRHNYKVALVAGQYVKIILDQRGIDIGARLYGTDAKKITDFDQELRPDKPEIIEFVAPMEGAYRLDIINKYPFAPAGRYAIRIVETHPATEKEIVGQQARNLSAESERLFDEGKYDESKQAVERSIEIKTRELGAKNLSLILDIDQLMRIYIEQGKYDEAIRSGEHILAIRRTHPEPDSYVFASILNRIGDGYGYLQDYPKSIEFYRQALEAVRSELGDASPSAAAVMMNLGEDYKLLGDASTALEMYQKALDVREKNGAHNEYNTAVVLKNIGDIYVERRDYQKAETVLLRAAAIVEKIYQPGNPRSLPALSALAACYAGMRNFQKAEELFKSILNVHEKSSSPLAAKAALDLGNLYALEKEFDKAEPLLRRALDAGEKNYGANSPLVGRILTDLALLAAEKGAVEESLKLQQRANEINERTVSLNLTVGSERQKLAYLDSLFEQTNQSVFLQAKFAPENAFAARLAATAVLRHKGRILDAATNNLATLRRRFSPPDAELLDRFGKITKQTAELILNEVGDQPTAEREAKIKSLTNERERVEDEISRRAAGFYASSKPVTLEAIQAVIPPDSVLVEFTIYTTSASFGGEKNTSDTKRYAAYVLCGAGEVKWKDLGDAQAIDAAVDALRQALRDPQSKDASSIARRADKLIMQPVRALAGDAKRFLISPDGALNLIPFEALVNENKHYLIEDYSFTYLTSGRDLLRMQTARPSRTQSLIVAAPSFGASENTQLALAAKTRKSAEKRRRSVTATRSLSDTYFAPLGATLSEARAIQKLFSGATVLTGSEATEAALKQARAPQILHIATHGFFLENAGSVKSAGAPNAVRGSNAGEKIENPLLRSGLALAGANRHGSGGEEDGILTALEASNLNLWGTRLVVLSACDTGLGEVKNGEGVYGLRRAFVLAGSESLVMSLWSVSDYTTRELMTNYYKNLKQGMGRGAALRAVQLEMLGKKGREHPFYWAGFIQSGEWANLDGKR